MISIIQTDWCSSAKCYAFRNNNNHEFFFAVKLLLWAALNCWSDCIRQTPTFLFFSMRKRKLVYIKFWPGWTVHVLKWACGLRLIGLKEIAMACHVQKPFFHHCKYWSWKTLARWMSIHPVTITGPTLVCLFLITSSLAPHACGSPPPLEHGDIRETRKFLYNHNERVQYLCQQYYRMEVQPYKTCKNGEWVGEEIKCYSKLPSMIHSNCFMTQRVLEAGENTNKRLQFDQSCTD